MRQMKQIAVTASTNLTNHVSQLPERIPLGLQPVYNTVMATEVEEHRQVP